MMTKIYRSAFSAMHSYTCSSIRGQYLDHNEPENFVNVLIYDPKLPSLQSTWFSGTFLYKGLYVVYYYAPGLRF